MSPPGWCSCPGGAFTPEAAAFLAAAGRRHVEKPFRPHELKQRVRELLAEQAERWDSRAARFERPIKVAAAVG